MNKLDFLSKEPKALIFGKNSNKTNFGGVLTLIYLIIVLIIAIAYIYDFSKNKKYEINYTYDYQYHNEAEFISKRNNDENTNPKLVYNLNIDKGGNPNLNESHFVLVSGDQLSDDEGMINFNKNYESHVYGLDFILYYICKSIENGSCIIWDEDKNELNMYTLNFNYLGFKLSHQNEETPIIREYTTNQFIFHINDQISFNLLRWRTIIYEEEQGISGIFDKLNGKKNEKYGGEFMDPLTFSTNEKDLFDDDYEESKIKTNMKIISLIGIDKNESKNYYDRYSRKKKSIWDPLANICSLSMSIYSGFIFVFCGFYSNHFDNNTIIERILFKTQKEIHNKINLNIANNTKEHYDDINNIKIKENDLNEDNVELIELSNMNNNKNDNLIDKNNEIDKKENNEADNDEKIVPKFHFWDYFYNNIFMKKYCSSKKQEVLNICDEIIAKYYSIDCIVYNQMRLENLFQDYKWNNEKCNNILNNKLIQELLLNKN